MTSPRLAKVRPIRKASGMIHSVRGECDSPSAKIISRMAKPDRKLLLAAHMASASSTSSRLSGVFMIASQVFCTCMRENAEYSASKVAVFIVL